MELINQNKRYVLIIFLITTCMRGHVQNMHVSFLDNAYVQNREVCILISELNTYKN